MQHMDISPKVCSLKMQPEQEVEGNTNGLHMIQFCAFHLI